MEVFSIEVFASCSSPIPLWCGWSEFGSCVLRGLIGGLRPGAGMGLEMEVIVMVLSMLPKLLLTDDKPVDAEPWGALGG